MCCFPVFVVVVVVVVAVVVVVVVVVCIFAFKYLSYSTTFWFEKASRPLVSQYNISGVVKYISSLLNINLSYTFISLFKYFSVT